MEDKKKVPRLRFPGFTDDWKQRKSGEIAPLRGGFAFKSNEYCAEGVPIVRISNILSDGSVGADFANYDEQDDDEAYALYDGAAVLAMSGATTGKVSVLHAEKGHKYYQNQRVGYFMPTDNCDYGFIRTLMKSQLFADQLSAVLVAGAQPNVSSKEIDGFEYMIPQSKEEQHRIGEYFSNLDTLIALHQRQLDNLKNLKKGCLQKMFPRYGETKPELRFPGFTDDWEQRKVSEITKFHKQGFYTTEDYNESKKYYLLRGTDLTENKLILKDTPKIDATEKDYQAFKTEVGDFLIVRSGTVGTYGIVYEDIPAIFGSYLIDFRFDMEQVTNEFFGYFYQSESFKTQLRQIVQQSANTNINAENIKSTSIMLPSIDEQKRIGEYLGQIDNLITLHQRELDELNQFKKGMLQQMFV